MFLVGRPNRGQIIGGHIPDMLLEAKIIDGLLKVTSLFPDRFLEAKPWKDHLRSHP